MLGKNNLNMRIAKIANIKDRTEKRLETAKLLSDIFDKLDIYVDDVIITTEGFISGVYRTLSMEDRLIHLYRFLIAFVRSGVISPAYLISIMEYVKLRLLRDLEKGFEREEK